MNDAENQITVGLWSCFGEKLKLEFEWQVSAQLRHHLWEQLVWKDDGQLMRQVAMDLIGGLESD
jgi:hypothetical protein